MTPFVLRWAVALAAPALLLAAPCQAQTLSLTGIGGIGRGALAPIYVGNEVKGYVLFGAGDRASARNKDYRFDFYDENLTKAASIALERPIDKFRFMRTAFNGQVFCLYSFNGGLRRPEMEVYDTSLKLLANKPMDALSGSDFTAMMSAQATGSHENAPGQLNLYPVPNRGFLRTTSAGELRRFGLEMYDNQLNQKWRVASDPHAPSYETVEVLGTSDKYAFGTIGRRPTIDAKNQVISLLAVDLETGRRVLDQPIEAGPTERLSLLSLTFDEARREFVAVGEYFAPTVEPKVGRSTGFYLKRFDETGKATLMQTYGWQQQVRAALNPAQQAGLDGGDLCAIQAVATAADGQRHLVIEQFRVIPDKGNPKYADKAGIRTVVFGPLLVLTLGADNRLTSAETFAKEAHEEPYYGVDRMHETGQLIERMRKLTYFDYQFLQQNAAKTRFNAVYLDGDRHLNRLYNQADEKLSHTLGNVAFGGNAPASTDKFDATTKATKSFIYPAKQGYVLMVDYLADTHRVEFKLIKMNI